VPSPPDGDDFRGDADRGLLRGAGAEVETDGARQAAQLRLGETSLSQPLEAVVVVRRDPMAPT
jgi:hypothetical protein